MKARPGMNGKDVTSKGVSSRTDNVAGSNLGMDNNDLSHKDHFLGKSAFPETVTR
jgi:hypothetical protein